VITQPLGLAAHLRKTPRSYDVLFYVNIGVLALFFTLFGSKYVLSPGIQFELPSDPSAVDSAMATGLVVNMQRDNLILFEGGRYSLEMFKVKLEEVAKSQTGKEPNRLLLRADRQTSTQALGAFISVAVAAGFGVQLAADVPPAEPSGLK